MRAYGMNPLSDINLRPAICWLVDYETTSLNQRSLKAFNALSAQFMNRPTLAGIFLEGAIPM